VGIEGCESEGRCRSVDLDVAPHALEINPKTTQPYEFDLLHADGIRHADLDAGVSVLNEVIHECHRSLEGIEHAKLDLYARGWARGMGLKE